MIAHTMTELHVLASARSSLLHHQFGDAEESKIRQESARGSTHRAPSYEQRTVEGSCSPWEGENNVEVSQLNYQI